MGTQPTTGPPLAMRRLPLPRGGDERLARQAGAGSARAFASLYEKYHQQLYRYCRSLVRHDADAQDALQSTMAKALAALQRDQRDAPLRPWLFRIAHNESISLLRRRMPSVEQLDLQEPATGSTEQLVDTRARLAQLVRDLQSLPERQRGALVMRELSGLSHEEIAIALQTTPGAAKQAIFDAREALAECAEGRAMVCEQARQAISAGDRRVLRGRRLRAHLASCDGCAAFAAAIPARQAELRMLAPPLAPLAATGLLAQLTPAGSAHGAGGAGAALSAGATQGTGAGLGAVASATAGKTIGATLATKALVGAAVVAVLAAGAATVVPRVTHDSSHAGKTTRGGATGTARPSPVRTTNGTPGGSYHARASHAGSSEPQSAASTSSSALHPAAPGDGAAIAHGRGARGGAPSRRSSAHVRNRHVAGAPAATARRTRSSTQTRIRTPRRPVLPAKAATPAAGRLRRLAPRRPLTQSIRRALPLRHRLTQAKPRSDST